MSDQTNRIEAELAENRAKLRETVEELGDRLAPQQMMHDASRALGMGAGELATIVARQVREKPIPTLVTAVGLALLAFGTTRSGNGAASAGEKKKDPGDLLDYPTRAELKASKVWDDYQQRAWSTAQFDDEERSAFDHRLNELRAEALGVLRGDDEDDVSFRDRVEAAAENTRAFAASCKRKLEALAHRAEEKAADIASAAGEAVGDAAEAATHAAKEAAKDAARDVRRGADRAAHLAGDAAATGMDAIGVGLEVGRNAMAKAKSGSADLFDAHPLAAGAIGFAIGAMAGSAAPLTKAERRRE